MEGLLDDERFTNNAARFAHRPELVAAIEEVTATRTRGEVLALLVGAGVPCSALQSYDEVAVDPQLTARGFFKESEHPRAGTVRQLGSAMNFGGAPLPVRRPSPVLGEHSVEILGEVGYDAGEIAALRERGVVTAP